MATLPQDPGILMSYLNTLLRDRYDSLEALCEDLEISLVALQEQLQAAGLCYDEGQKRVR